MPSNYDMIVSQSPPVFSHSPPTGFLSEYTASYRRPYEPPQGFSRLQQQPWSPSPSFSAFTSHHYLSSHHNGARNFLQHQQMKAISVLNLKSLPNGSGNNSNSKMPKSCLKPQHNYPSAADNDDHEHGEGAKSDDETTALDTALGCDSNGGWKPKKTVIFADDKGLELTQIKVMNEPSNVPPFWSLQFLAEVTHGLISPVSTAEQWIVDFKQPASDYLQFRQKLDDQKVSLENVIVKENESIVVGTIKVKNLGYNKEVIVRVTYDHWKNQEDIFCTFNSGVALSGSYSLYDTFSFKITLPPSSKKSVEFCVCFRCNDTEYWDNNTGNNYTLSKRTNAMDRVEKDGILYASAAATTSPSKLNQVTSLIQELKEGGAMWNGGGGGPGANDHHYHQHRPYW